MKPRQVFGEWEACIGRERLADYRADSLEEEDHSAVAEHLMQCALCRTELAMIDRFMDAELSQEEEKDVDWIVERLQLPGSEHAFEKNHASWRQEAGSRRRLWSGFEKFGAIAAALLVVVAGSLYFGTTGLDLGDTRPPGDVERAVLELLDPSGEQTAPPRFLEWREVPGAASYSVSLLEVDHSELWKGQSVSTRVALPEEIQKRMIPGRRFLWRVTARAGDDRELLSSEFGSFTMTVK